MLSFGQSRDLKKSARTFISLVVFLASSMYGYADENGESGKKEEEKKPETMKIEKDTKDLLGGLIAGNGSESLSQYSIAIGDHAKAKSHNSIAIGERSITGKEDYKNNKEIPENNRNNVSIGFLSNAKEGYGTALGSRTRAFGRFSTAIGSDAFVGEEGQRAVSIGARATVGENYKESSTLTSNDDKDSYDTAKDFVRAEKELINANITNNSTGENNGQYASIAIGRYSHVTSDNSVAIGHMAEVTAKNTVAIGALSDVHFVDNGIAIGSYAVVDKGEGKIGYNPLINKENEEKLKAIEKLSNDLNNERELYYLQKYQESGVNDEEKKLREERVSELYAQGYYGDKDSVKEKLDKQIEEVLKDNENIPFISTHGSVSVGNAKKGITRQITNVAAGSEDTDAVNVAQLKSSVKMINNVDKKVTEVRNGEAGIAVYTDRDGNRVKKALDGQYYKVDAFKEDGVLTEDSADKKINLKDLSVSLVRQGEYTKEEIVLRNVADGKKDTDAVNVRQLNAKETSLKAEISTVNDEVTKVKTDVQGLDSKVTNHEERITSLESKADKQEQINKHFTEGINQTNAQVTALKAKTNQIADKVQGVEKQVTDTNTRISNVDSKFDDKVAGINNDIIGVKDRVTKVESSVANLDSRVGSLENNLENTNKKLEDETSNLSKEIKDLGSKVETKVGNLEGKVDTEVSNIKNEIEKTNNRVAAVENDVNSLKSKVDTVKEDLNKKIDSTSKELKEKIAGVDSKLDKESKDLNDKIVKTNENLESKSKELSKEIKNVDKELKETTKELDEKITGVDTALKETTQNLEKKITENKNDITALDKKITGVDERVSTVDKKLGNLDERVNTEVSNIKGEMENTNNKVAVIEKDVDNLKSKVNTVDEKVDTVDKKLEEKSSELSGKISDVNDSLASTSKELGDRITGVDSRVTEVSNKTDKLSEELEKTNNSISKVDEKLDTTTKDLSGKINSVKETVTTTLKNLKDKITGVDTRVTEVSKDLKAKTDKINEEIGKTNTKVAEVDKKLNDKTDKLSGEIEDVKVTIKTTEKELDGKISDVKNDVTELGDKITGVDTKVTDLTSKVEDNKTKIDVVGKEVASVDKKLDAKVSEVKDEISGVNDRVSDVDTKVDQVNENLNGKINQVKDKVSKVDDKVNKVDTRVNEVDTKVSAVDTKVDKLDEKLDEKTSELQGDIVNTNNRITKVDSEVKRLNSKVNSLENNLESTNQKLDETSNELSGRIDDVNSNLASASKELGDKISGVDKKVDAKADELQKGLNQANNNILKVDIKVENVKNNKLNKDLSNLTPEGSTVISNIARDSIELVEGHGIDITKKEEGNKTIYTIETEHKIKYKSNGELENKDEVDGVRPKSRRKKRDLDAVMGEFVEVDGSTPKEVSAEEGLNFVNGKNTIATTAGHGVVSFHISKNLENIETITSYDGKDLTLIGNGTEVNLTKDKVSINNKKIIGVADGEVKENSKDAVNGGQLHAVEEEVKTKANKDLDNLSDKGATKVKELAKSSIEVKSEGKIKVRKEKDGDKDVYTVTSTSQEQLGYKTEDGKELVLKDNELFVKDGKTERKATEEEKASQKAHLKDAEGKADKEVRLSNIADGEISETSNDAVNGRQLRAVKNEVKTSLNQTNRRVDKLEESIARQNEKIESLRKDLNTGMAQLSAMSAVDFGHTKKKKVKIGAGLGGYKGERAVAVGVAISPTDNLLINAKMSMSAKDAKNAAFGVGATYEFNYD